MNYMRHVPIEADHFSLEQHFAEVSSLLGHRGPLFRDTDIHWLEMADYDSRLSQHLNALCAAGETAIELARAAVWRFDPGDRRAGVWLLTQTREGCDRLSELLSDWDRLSAMAGDDRVDELERSWFEGLKLGRPDFLAPILWLMVRFGNLGTRRWVAEVIGYQRLPMSDLLAELLDDPFALVAGEAALSLGKLGDTAFRPRLEALLRELHRRDERDACDLVATGLKLIGSVLPSLHARGCLQVASSLSPVQAELLAMEGRYDDLDRLCELCRRPEIGPEMWAVLGVLGYPDAVPYLLNVMEALPQAVEPAREALWLLTGASPAAGASGEMSESSGSSVVSLDTEDLEDDWVESLDEIVDLDDMEESPASSGEPAQAPAPAPHEPVVWWREWWRANGHRFEEGSRYRLGRPFSVEAVVAEIQHPNSSFAHRRRALIEVSRFVGMEPGLIFEPDEPVSRQQERLAQLKLPEAPLPTT
ncbi:hypothetical protein SCOR_29390 [Sulfidibacter corallicola]|uniref:TIGR02270 family protein n=1 Tax=Sulfidibacter corallicola TaxID=2818388 RepID=A0A8A4TJY3_SULCO|nr:hypothetical protein [Sulfidibacter corallicola]QTD50329.1 hypothetical protein J3U87_32495 [Sulfidibacter corallicola]